MSLLFLILTTIFSVSVINRLNLPYENGRFFDEKSSVVLQQQSTSIYFLLFAITLIVTIILIFKLVRIKRKTGGAASIK